MQISRIHLWCKLFILFFLLSSQGLTSQCYVQLSNYSGVDFSLDVEELNSIACELVDLLPGEFNDFKVYSRIDYLHSSSFSDTDNIGKLDGIDSEGYLLINKRLEPKSGDVYFDLEVVVSDGFSPCLDLDKLNNDLISFANALFQNSRALSILSFLN